MRNLNKRGSKGLIATGSFAAFHLMMRLFRPGSGRSLLEEGAELVVSSLDEIAVGELTHGGLNHRVV
jgi:hypothetical protein